LFIFFGALSCSSWRRINPNQFVLAKKQTKSKPEQTKKNLSQGILITVLQIPACLKLLAAASNKGILSVRFGLVAQLVEQCPFNSKPRVLAIFSKFLFPFVTIAEPLISLVILDV
jgi:hypothetical protein